MNNVEINRNKRRWAKDEQKLMAPSVYRFRECFDEPDSVQNHFKTIPFLNVGLFECLDNDLGEKVRRQGEHRFQ